MSFSFDEDRLKAFIALLQDGKASAKRRAELARRLLRNGHITLDELRYVSLAFKQAYIDGYITEREYTMVRAWLRACVSSMVIPRQRMEDLQVKAGAAVTAMRA